MADSSLEAGLEAFFRKRVRLVGGYTVKLAPTEKGMPDRLVVMPGGRMYLVELKTATGAVSPAQRVWHDRMAAKGVHVHVVTGKDGVVHWLRRIVSSIADPRSKRGRPPADRVS